MELLQFNSFSLSQVLPLTTTALNTKMYCENLTLLFITKIFSFGMLHLFIKFICKNFSTYNFLSTYNWNLCFHKYLGTKDSQLCFINAAHKHFITKTKKSQKQYLILFWGREAEGPRIRCLNVALPTDKSSLLS